MKNPKSWEETGLKVPYKMGKFSNLHKIIELVRIYNHGWEPNWEDDSEDKFCLYFYGNEIVRNTHKKYRCIMAFKHASYRDSFLDNFKNLITETKELL